MVKLVLQVFVLEAIVFNLCLASFVSADIIRCDSPLRCPGLAGFTAAGSALPRKN